jgi:hypothetical protein
VHFTEGKYRSVRAIERPTIRVKLLEFYSNELIGEYPKKCTFPQIDFSGAAHQNCRLFLATT